MTDAWPEPLTATAADAHQRFVVTVRAADGRTAAFAPVDCYPPHAELGWIYLEPGGTARQRVRAAVLLIREAFRHAGDAGVRYWRAEAVPGPLQELGARLHGGRGRRHRSGHEFFSGELAPSRTRVLLITDDQGNIHDGG